jgi:hypothetical protein
MVSGQCALDVSEPDFGRRPEIPTNCFLHGTIKGR